MDSINGVGSAAATASAGADNSVNLNVLKDTQNLSQDIINRLFSTLGLGANFSGQG